MATVSASAPGPSRSCAERQPPLGRLGSSYRQVESTTLTLLIRFAQFAGSRTLAVAAGLIVAGAALESFGILLIVPLLQVFLAPGTAPSPITQTVSDRLLEPLGVAWHPSLLLAGFAGLMLVRAGVIVARDASLARLQWGFIESIKVDLFRRLALASWKDVMDVDRLRLNRALGSDMVQVGVAVNAALQTVTGALVLAAYSAIAFAIAPAVSILTLGGLAAIGLAGFGSVKRAGAFGRAALGYDLRMEESASHFLAGLKLAKAQNLEAGFVARYAQASRDGVATRVAFVQSVSASRQTAALFGAAAAAVAALAALTVTDSEPAVLIATIVLLLRTGAPVAQIQQGLQQVANALPVFADMHDLGTRLPPMPVERTAHPALAEAPYAISLSRARRTHRSPDGDMLGGIRAVSLTIAPGECVGVSGPTGSGKSTLLDLIAGLERPDAGTITFAGKEPREPELAAHRSTLAYLSAEPVLFGGTVRSNLAWAAPGASDEAMWDALEKACAADLVGRLGAGLDSRIHEAGANLSSGERQQIALARALVRRPSLLLLDEATSSLDREREGRVLGNLATLDPRPTIVFVSHRTDGLTYCDRIVGISEGQITSSRRMA